MFPILTGQTTETHANDRNDKEGGGWHQNHLEGFSAFVELKSPASEALPVNNVRSVLLIFLQTYPRRVERLQVSKHRATTPHREVSVHGADDMDTFPCVRGQQALDLHLESLGEPRQ